MSTGGKHVTVHLGIWTIVVNKTASSFFAFEWLGRARRWCWTVILHLMGFPRWTNVDSLTNEKRSDTGWFRASTELQSFAYLWIFVKEIYLLGPTYFVAEMLLYFWATVNGALELYFTSHLLNLTSEGLRSGNLQPFPLAQALVCKVLLPVLSTAINKKGESYTTIFRERVKYHFIEKVMRSALNFDLMTLEDPEVRGKINRYGTELISQRSEVWEAFSDLLEVLRYLVSIVSEISVMLRMSRNGSTFVISVILGIIHPLLNSVDHELYARSYVAFCSNPHFLRMTSLHRLAFDNEFREDRISNGLGHYISREFKKSRKLLGDVNTEDAHLQWGKNRPSYVAALTELAWEPFLIIFTLQLLWDRRGVTLDDLVLVQQSSQRVQSTMYILIHNFKKVSGSLLTVRNIYSLEDVENHIEDGDISYPIFSEGRNHAGAEIEFRNVSFAYPGADTNALSDVSFTIQPGQLVVIIGVNGSGKTSVIKLLSRLHDPTRGEILLDGRPLPSYRLEDVRRATVILRQNHPILPVSLRENVALGLPQRSATNDEIEEAIQRGGASTYVHRLRRGLDTELRPVSTITMNIANKEDEDLKAVVEDREVSADLSGGESQRLSASRTFMRLMGDNTRLLIADEPTSALDPEGEYELFKRLREHSKGKTAIFITHRFGHLTKRADLILCLKDGELVEQGNHNALMELGGEYQKLYSVQAGGFNDQSS